MGQARVESEPRIGIKLFVATKAKERESMGERVTEWLDSNAHYAVFDKRVLQTSDRSYHCLTIALFYRY